MMRLRGRGLSGSRDQKGFLESELRLGAQLSSGVSSTAAGGASTSSFSATNSSSSGPRRDLLLGLGGELEAAELHFFRIDRDRLGIDVVGELHGEVFDHRVREAEVALELVNEPAAADVLHVDVDAFALLRDGVRELATAPRLELHELALLALDDFGDAVGDLVGRVGVDVVAEDVDRLVFAEMLGAGHSSSFWAATRRKLRRARNGGGV
jgi:hypothetical protein